MRIGLITGSYPPQICGVGDYTHSLAVNLRRAGVSVEVFTGSQWPPFSVGRAMHEMMALNVDIWHIQYPTRGYGRQLGPQLLSLRMPLVTTIHEVSQVHMLRQLSLLPFTIRSPKIIFTTEHEKRYLARGAPWICNRACVIPIGSNVVITENLQKPLSKVVTYFGLIRPEKGLEQVLEVARIFQQSGKRFRIEIIGSSVPGFESYYEKIRSLGKGLPIDWKIGLEREELSMELAKARVSYLPFPDGASERRSSLIAMMMNRVAIVTTRGTQTPESMDGVVAWAGSAAEAATRLERLIDLTGEQESLQERAKAYAARYTWEGIALQHQKLYSEVIASKSFSQKSEY